MKTLVLTLAILLLVSIQHSTKSEAGTYDWSPPHQFTLNEICVNYLCYKGRAHMSATDSVFILSRGGKSVTVIIEKVTILPSGLYFFSFEHQRGFMSVGRYDHVAFLFLDKNNIILHIEKSSLNPRHTK